MSEIVNDQDQLLEKTRLEVKHEEKGQALDDRYGKVLFKLLIWLVLALVIFQLLLHYEPSRPYISPIQQMEGVPVNEPNVNDWIGENTPSLLHHSS
ncbi:DUF5359 family protein [Paenibacillus lautus]|uniref:DUF5359 family protein n=1 Tax=Paenibacillus lautus TaxID=1401 RepID=UPI002DBE6C43|nr:DUF5359 family protein [Paenibacillus lautus]MEC0205746.1 DUF5359 family protein [Paenibacillus lautus]